MLGVDYLWIRTRTGSIERIISEANREHQVKDSIQVEIVDQLSSKFHSRQLRPLELSVLAISLIQKAVSQDKPEDGDYEN